MARLLKNQNGKRQELPNGLNKETQNDKFEDYIVEQFKNRDQGVWTFINGKPIYTTGVYWFGIQWVRRKLSLQNLGLSK
jgi:hypothetical protein